MAFLTGGPYYDMIGRAGNNVGRKVKGRNVFSMRPSKSNKPASLPQLNQRNKFGLLTGWTANLNLFIDAGFRHYDAKMSPMNACISYNSKRNVIVGSTAPFTIDYSKMVLSRGKLAGISLPTVATGTGISVVFDWGANLGENNAEPDDKLSFAVYDPTTDEFAIAMKVVNRSALSYELLLPAEFSGNMVQVWLMCTSNELVSDSVHLGPVPVG
ncbi:DUF6266 family protein [Pedobacter sp. GR22-6]|uniref:DUF6266 family protein n=1 Tax=Pedobacter sp. GR22-6 TaxID=3127957 RepID=UPI00307D112D